MKVYLKGAQVSKVQTILIGQGIQPYTHPRRGKVNTRNNVKTRGLFAFKCLAKLQPCKVWLVSGNE